MTNHESRLSHDILEKDVCELLCLDDIFVTETVDCFPIATEETVFPLAPQIVEAEQKLELERETSHQLRDDLNDTNSNIWCYREVEGTNNFAVKPTCISIKKSQANVIVERIHQVVGSMLKTNDLVNRIFDAIDPWGNILAAIAYAIRCSYHSTLQATPGQLVFGRDMLLDIKCDPDWTTIQQRKQKIVNYNNKRENNKRVPHDYKVGDFVYIIKDGVYRKLEGDKLGPFPITQVFTNGTVRIQRDLVNERINIRRLTPHFGEPPE